MKKPITTIILLFTILTTTAQEKRGALTLRVNPKFNINNVTGARYGYRPNTFGGSNIPDGQMFSQLGFDAQVGYRHYLPKNNYVELEFGKHTISPKFRADYSRTGGIYKPFHYTYHYGVLNLNFGKHLEVKGKNHLSLFGGVSWLLDLYKNSHVNWSNPLYLKSGEKVEGGEVLLLGNYRNWNTAIFVYNLGANYTVLLDKRISIEFGLSLSQGFKPITTDVVYFLLENEQTGQVDPIGESLFIANGQAINSKIQMLYNINKK